MKRIKKTLLLLLLCLVTSVIFIPTLAKDETASVRRAVSFDMMAARTEGVPGVRFIYDVDFSEINTLEKKYRVALGAVIGVGELDGKTVHTTSTLCVKGDAQNGFAVDGVGMTAVTVYATDSPSYVTGIFRDEEKSAFAYTVAYGTADAEKYGVTLVSRAFVALTEKGSGKTDLYYIDAQSPIDGKEATSLTALCEHLCAPTASSVSRYLYANSQTVKGVLQTAGKTVPSAAPAPATLVPVEGEVLLTDRLSYDFLHAAREKYKTPSFADYTSSIVGEYSGKATADDHIDSGKDVTLSWEASDASAVFYTLELSRSSDFSPEKTVRYNQTATQKTLSGLFVDTTYYWRVRVYDSEGHNYYTPTSTLKTAESVRWITVDGVRNVRDVGGWNGMNQGLVYRGSELNLVSNHGLALTIAGKNTMRNLLGIKTDLDFRAPGNDCGNIEASPIGTEVAYVRHPTTAFMPMFGGNYTSTMRVFADYANYPIYMHCWGGADRTGTAAFILQGLCGVSEEDLAIDLEMTSFSIFGNRYRFDNSSYLYASMIKRVKLYEGETLQQKFENCARLDMGLTEAEISNIQAINMGEGAVFTGDSLENVRIDIMSATDSFSLGFYMRGSKSIKSLTLAGVEIPFSFDAKESRLTVKASDLLSADFSVCGGGALFVGGIGVITFDDGSTLRFYAENSSADAQISTAVRGDLGRVLLESDGEKTQNGAAFIFTDAGEIVFSQNYLHSLLVRGYETVTFTLSATGADTISARLVTLDGGEYTPLSLVGTGGVIGETKVSLSIAHARSLVISVPKGGVVRITGVSCQKKMDNYAAAILSGDASGLFRESTKQPDGSYLYENIQSVTLSYLDMTWLAKAGYSVLSFTVDVDVPNEDGCQLVAYVDINAFPQSTTLNGTGGHIAGKLLLSVSHSAAITLTLKNASGEVVRGNVSISSVTIEK